MFRILIVRRRALPNVKFTFSEQNLDYFAWRLVRADPNDFVAAASEGIVKSLDISVLISLIK